MPITGWTRKIRDHTFEYRPWKKNLDSRSSSGIQRFRISRHYRPVLCGTLDPDTWLCSHMPYGRLWWSLSAWNFQAVGSFQAGDEASVDPGNYERYFHHLYKINRPPRRGAGHWRITHDMVNVSANEGNSYAPNSLLDAEKMSNPIDRYFVQPYRYLSGYALQVGCLLH